MKKEMKPKQQQKLVFDNQCNCNVDYNVLEKAMLWYSDGNLKSTRIIFMFGSYPGVNIYYERIHVHRLIAMYLNKSRVCSSIHTHHKDGNKLNCNVNNIELVNGSEHLSHHNKGRKLTEDHKRKIGEANRKRIGMKMKRKYNIPLDELALMLTNGMPINKIAKYYGCSWSTIKNRINENELDNGN